MDFNMDELQQRRKQRQQEQQQRLRQQRKLFIRLGIAAAVLLLCGLLILGLRFGGDSQPPQTTGTAAEPSADTVEQTAASTEAKPETVIHFVAAGDLNVTDEVVAAGGANYDYTDAFMDVVPLLSAGDLTAVNMEGILCGAPYGGENHSAPLPMVEALAAAGVDIIQVANSYAIRKGVSGLVTTLRSIELTGMDPVGAFADEGEYKKTGGYNIYVVNGVRVAVVAYTKGMDGMALPGGSEKCVNVLYKDYSSTYREVDTQGITKLLRNVAAQKPDVTIVLIHWGSEYNDTHSDSQNQIRDLMFAEGVDAIIGTHPHSLQEMVFDEKAGTFIAYSLGDFFGDGTTAGTEYSVILDLEITKNNETGDARITGYSYTPIFTTRDARGQLRVLRLDNAMAAYEAGHIDRVSAQAYDAMVYAKKRIQARIHPEQE